MALESCIQLHTPQAEPGTTAGTYSALSKLSTSLHTRYSFHLLPQNNPLLLISTHSSSKTQLRGNLSQTDSPKYSAFKSITDRSSGANQNPSLRFFLKLELFAFPLNDKYMRMCALKLMVYPQLRCRMPHVVRKQAHHEESSHRHEMRECVLWLSWP